mmetsp:Transcript_4416/g.13391  ORF Transcript_4416/g.13391 Transcript_4416/m.13391 type:complete len:772 (+) Transcript_4416:139-2454(+)
MARHSNHLSDYERDYDRGYDRGYEHVDERERRRDRGDSDDRYDYRCFRQHDSDSDSYSGSARRCYEVYRYHEVRRERNHSAENIRRSTRKMILRVFCGTWNVNGKRPHVDLEPWLFPDGKLSKPIDLYIVGFQEAQSLSKMAAVMTDYNKGKAWTEQIQRTLGNGYIRVCMRQLVGIMLVIFVRPGIEIKDLMVADAGTGFFNVVGNKGGVAARFVINGVSLSCVSSHLAAHEQNISKRNQNFQDILKRATFGVGSADEFGQGPEGIHILDHDVVFWLGDMNYRIALPVHEVMHLIHKKDWKTLARYDQLRIEMDASRVAPGFEEGALNFAPTYKYEADQDRYKMDEEGGIHRTPSWTDRILWRTHLGVRLQAYKRHNVLSSDHRPVSAVFEVPTPYPVHVKRAAPRDLDFAAAEPVDSKKSSYDEFNDEAAERNRQQEVDKIQQALPRAVNIQYSDNDDDGVTPEVLLSTRQLVLPKMTYGRRVQASVQAQCVGRTPAKVSVNPRSVPKWCSVSLSNAGKLSQSSTIKPQDELLVTVSGLVDRRHGLAEAVTLDGRSLCAEVVLDVDSGTGVVLRVQGSYNKSSFGLPLERLVQCWEPIRYRPVSSTTPQALPKEVWLLGEAIYSASMPFPHDVQTNASYEDVRDLVDVGMQVHARDYAGAAACLLAMLRELPEPVLSKEALDVFLRHVDSVGSREAASMALECLPEVSRNMIVYLSALVRQLPGAEQNDSAIAVLAAALMQTRRVDATRLLHNTPYNILFPTPVASAAR